MKRAFVHAVPLKVKDPPPFTVELREYQEREQITVEELAVRAQRKWFTVYRWLRGAPANPDAQIVVREKLGLA